MGYFSIPVPFALNDNFRFCFGLIVCYEYVSIQVSCLDVLPHLKLFSYFRYQG